MTNIHQLPQRSDVEWLAAAWVERMQADDVTEADRARCLAWRSEHPLHERLFQETLATYRLAVAAGPMVRATSFGIAMHAATARRRHRRWHMLAAAASVLLVLLAVVVAPRWEQWHSGTPSRFETGIGDRAAVTLPDGSRMELNSDSAARVAYSDEARIIRLARGEAYFTVAHDADRPFWVVAGNTWVRAVGTAFNVYQREGGVRVTVSEGKVKVASVPHGGATPSDVALARASVSLLEAGAQADLRADETAVRALPPLVMEREVSWRTGTVHFEDRPLHEVAQELGRYTPLRIELGPQARDVRVGGTFQTNPAGVDALLATLQDGFGLQVRREDGKRVYVE